MLNVNIKSKPKYLKKGDSILPITVSSAIQSQNKILEGIKVFESWGLICKSNNLSTRNWGYLAGTDQVRYKNLHPKSNPSLMAFTPAMIFWVTNLFGLNGDS